MYRTFAENLFFPRFAFGNYHGCIAININLIRYIELLKIQHFDSKSQNYYANTAVYLDSECRLVVDIELPLRTISSSSSATTSSPSPSMFPVATAFASTAKEEMGGIFYLKNLYMRAYVIIPFLGYAHQCPMHTFKIFDGLQRCSCWFFV